MPPVVWPFVLKRDEIAGSYENEEVIVMGKAAKVIFAGNLIVMPRVTLRKAAEVATQLEVSAPVTPTDCFGDVPTTYRLKPVRDTLIAPVAGELLGLTLVRILLGNVIVLVRVLRGLKLTKETVTGRLLPLPHGVLARSVELDIHNVDGHSLGPVPAPSVKDWPRNIPERVRLIDPVIGMFNIEPAETTTKSTPKEIC